MGNLSKFCPAFFKSKLSLFFLIAQLVFSAFILDWNKMFFDTESIEETHYKSEPKEDAPKFSGCFPCENESPFDIEIVKLPFLLISLPSTLVTKYLLVDLKFQHPQWSNEKIVTIGNIAFIIFNSVWWMFLAYGIENIHENYLRNKKEPEKPFTIFSGLD